MNWHLSQWTPTEKKVLRLEQCITLAAKVHVKLYPTIKVKSIIRVEDTQKRKFHNKLQKNVDNNYRKMCR